MPTTPQPGDPSYVEWLRMANSYGMTVDELYQAMVAYPAEQGAGSNYPTRPVPPPSAAPATSAHAVSAPAPSAVGMYQGQGYDYPAQSGALGMFGATAGEFLEILTTRHMEGQIQRTQEQHAAELNKYNSLPDGVMKDLAMRNVLMLEAQWDELETSSQTAGSEYRAMGDLFQNPSLYPMQRQLMAETPGRLNISFPVLQGRITTSPGELHDTGFSADTVAPAAAPAGTSKEGDFGTFGKTGDFGTFGAPASLTRGGYSYTPPGMPTEGLATPYRGPYPSAGNIPEGGGAGGIVETPDRRGFASFAALREGMGDDWRPWQRPEGGGYPRGGTNLIRGSAGQLREHIGDTTPFGYYRGGRDEGYYDLGQGEQKYIIRRDGMGNIRSFTPASQATGNLNRFGLSEARWW